MRILFLLLTAFCSFSCQSQQMDATAFEKKLTDSTNLQLLDTRTATEFQSGHLNNAMQANWNNLEEFRQRTAWLSKEKPVYVYCLAGVRSEAAAQWLRENGFREVINLEGGINAWKKAGLPVVGNSTETQMTLADFRQLLPANKTVLVDIGAGWCPPCRKMEPVLNELEKDKTIRLLRIDAGVHTNLQKELGVTAIPAFIIYKNGKETGRLEGVVTKEQLQQLLR